MKSKFTLACLAICWMVSPHWSWSAPADLAFEKILQKTLVELRGAKDEASRGLAGRCRSEAA